MIKDSISTSKKSTYFPWCEILMEIRKIPALDNPNQPLIRSKELSDSVYDTL